MSFRTYGYPLVGAHYLLSRTYKIGRALDDWNYWHDYYRNTGYRARYRFRSGSYDYLRIL